MVYQCLLEKDERTLWRIYLLGRKNTFISYEELQNEYQFTAKKIQRLCEWWSEIENEKKSGIAFVPSETGVQVQLTEHFCERILWHQLLTQSLTFQLLWQKLMDPLVTITQLSQQHYVARKTIWRRLEGLKPLWQNFNLRLDDNFQNCIMGLESQKRYLILQLKKMQLPDQKEDVLLPFMKEISATRANFGFTISQMESKILHSRAPQLAYHLDERGFQFLLQQLLGQEIWLPKCYETFRVTFTDEPQLKSYSEATIQDIYRYHLCLQLFCGDSIEEFFSPPKQLSEAILLESISQKCVDKYTRFTRKHKHVVNGYDYVLKKVN